MIIHYIYLIENNFKEIKTMSKKNFELSQEWFYENYMALSSGKCHYLVINKDNADESVDLGKLNRNCLVL